MPAQAATGAAALGVRQPQALIDAPELTYLHRAPTSNAVGLGDGYAAAGSFSSHQRAEDADPQAVEELFAALYRELHRLAEHHQRRAEPNNSLGATTLLHEEYLNIANREGITFTDRNRFFAYASRAMRGLVIDCARQRRSYGRTGASSRSR